MGFNVHPGKWKPESMYRALAFLMLCFGSMASATEVKSVRVRAGNEYTRATIELSDTAEYRVFTLAGPDRLVVDVINGRLRSSVDSSGKGLVRSVRSGQPEADRLRIVFDLTEAVRPKSFMLDKPDSSRRRLVVDMVPASAPKQPAQTASTTVASAAALPVRDVVIAIDAGHGGEDPGAIGAKGTHEKVVTLKMAQLLAKRINAEPGMRAVLIRDSDVFIPLQTRFQKARDHKADLLVLHDPSARQLPRRGAPLDHDGGHAYAVIAGYRWDTSGDSGGETGPRWHEELRTNAGFTARHPAGF